MKRARVRLRVVKRPSRFWTPGTDVVKEILRRYGDAIDNGDFIVISDKALSVAYGYLYDESRARASSIDTLFTKMIVGTWLHILRPLLAQYVVEQLKKTPLHLLAIHKKVVCYICRNPIHVLKPVSECGIDTTNLPYSYVSTPISRCGRIVNEIRTEIEHRLGKKINVLVIDSDLCFKMKSFPIAITSRPSTVPGVISLGVIAYIAGHIFRRMFKVYPTPVAYSGTWIGLEPILRIARLAEKARGHGLGRTLSEMLRNLGRDSFSEIRWIDLAKHRHYPVILVKVTEIEEVGYR